MQINKENTMTVDSVIAALEARDGRYKREEIDWAIVNREQIIPRLLAILDNALADPRRIVHAPAYKGHIYAVMLLGYFRTAEAHEKIIRLLNLPESLPEQMFHDVLTECMPTILVNTCSGCVTGIKSVLENNKASNTTRFVAGEALTYAVAAGQADRDEALSSLGKLFAAPPNNDPDFRAFMVMYMVDLCPAPWMDEIRQAYADGLVDEMWISLDMVEDAAARGEAACLADVRAKMATRSLDDLHPQLAWSVDFVTESDPRPTVKVGRNDPCPCGSGKKHKRCCLNR